MILALEYEHLKKEATESLASLYSSFLKRVDRSAKDAKESWAENWVKYREGDEIDLNKTIEAMPDWMQFTFQHFANQQRFNREIERAFIDYENELSNIYKLGFDRGQKSVTQKPSKSILTESQKEDLRLKTIFEAEKKWPELYN